jgi:hypothetical protein
MFREWKLWPREYEYGYGRIIWGIGFDLVMAAFIFRSMNRASIFYIGNKEVSFTQFLIPVCGILAIGIFIAVWGILNNIKVSKLRKERKHLMETYKCYDGTISAIERLQVNDVVKSQADNIHHRYTRVLNKLVVDYIDEDGRKRIATSEEYGEYLCALLKDRKARVYVSEDGKHRIVDDLSWRQSSKDEYIQLPGEHMRKLIKRFYYRLLRWKNMIQVLTYVLVFTVLFILILID